MIQALKYDQAGRSAVPLNFSRILRARLSLANRA